MPRGIPKVGYRRTKRRKALSLEEVERNIVDRVPYYLEELEKLTKPYPCPHCGNEIHIIDKDVGMYLMDRAMGKPKQRQEIDVTATIARQFTADQIDEIVERHPILSRVHVLAELIARYPANEDKVVEILNRICEMAQREMLPKGSVIEAEYSEAMPEKTETDAR